MDPVTTSIALATFFGPALYKALEKLVEKGIVDPALEKGLESVKQWLTREYDQAQEAQKLGKMLEAAFQKTIKTQSMNETARDQWLSKLERIKTDETAAQQTIAATLALIHEADPLPPELVKTLHLEEAQQSAFRRFLWELRQALASHPAYSAALTYIEELGQRHLSEGIYERLAVLSEVTSEVDGQKVVRVQVVSVAEDVRVKEKKYLDNALIVFRDLPLGGRTKEDDMARPDDQLRLEQVYIALNTTTSRHRYLTWVPLASMPDLFLLEEKLVAQPLSALCAVMETRRLVLVGDPGSGKSTLAQHLCLCLAGARRAANGEWQKYLRADDVTGWELGQYPFPVFVRLRLFAEDIESLPVDPKQMGRAEHLLAYLLKEIGKLGREMDDHARDLLEGGQVLVVCDGLDEVTHPTGGKDAGRLDAQRREQVVQAIQHFSACYPFVRLIVTCRIKQYSLDVRGRPTVKWGLEGWPVFTLADFDREQVTQFVTHWFDELKARGRQSTAEADEKRATLLHALGTRPDLAELAPKPILLTQMALVHAHRKLPDSRIEVYTECAQLLLWDWPQLRARQSGRQGEAAEDFLEKLLPGLRLNEVEDALDRAVFDAHAAGEADIPAERVRLALAALFQRVYAQAEDEAIGLAQRFIIHWLRACNGLLIPAGEQTLTVPHRSFREFMAARFLNENPLLNPETGDEDEWECSAPRLVRDNPNKWWEVFRFVAGLNSASKIANALEELYPDGISADVPVNRECLLLAGEVMRDAGGKVFSVKSKRGEKFYQRAEGHLIHLMRDTDPARPYPADGAAPRLTAPKALPPRLRLAAGELLNDLDLWTPSDLDAFCAISGKPNFWIGKHLVANLQYARFLKAPDYADETLWHSVTGFDAKGQPLKDIGAEAWEWFGKVGGKDHRPSLWDNAHFGASRRLFPVVGVTWYEAAAYCVWLTRHWKEVLSGNTFPDNIIFRLPLEAEWVDAAGGEEDDRYPWQKTPEKVTKEQIATYANTGESDLGGTTPVCMYPAGQSPHGVMDMAGNVWEWQANMRDDNWQALRGGSWVNDMGGARGASRHDDHHHFVWHFSGFRVVGVAPISL